MGASQWEGDSTGTFIRSLESADLFGSCYVRVLSDVVLFYMDW